MPTPSRAGPSARLLNVTIEEYHADPCVVPSLSASIAREMISRSPLHAWQIHPRLGGKAREASNTMDAGSLLHALLLGQPLSGFAVLPFENFRTKAAQEARGAEEEQGRIVIRESELMEAKRIAAILHQRLGDLEIVLDGVSEMQVEWDEMVDGAAVRCRGMMDHVRSATPTIFDLKTTRSADLKSISRSIIEYGYDIQGAAYTSALGKLRPETCGRVDFVLAFLETEPPYAVTPVRFDGALRSLGVAKWERACREWERCLRTNLWPAYVDRITPVEAPAWALMETIF